MAYDSWLMATALVKKIPVVEATEIVTALHQTETAGNCTSFRAKFERYINAELAPDFGFSHGHITCAHFATQLKEGIITIMGESSIKGEK